MAMLFQKVEEPIRGALLEEAEHCRWAFKVYIRTPFLLTLCFLTSIQFYQLPPASAAMRNCTFLEL